MEMADLLDNLNKRDIEVFRKDFTQLMRVTYGMDNAYGKSDKVIDKYMEKYSSLIELFNKKYKNLRFKLIISKDEIKLKLFLTKEKDIKNILPTVTKIAGIKAIGAGAFDVANIMDKEKFSREMDNITTKAHISYYGPEHSSNTIFIELNKKEGIEIYYDIKCMLNEISPEFKLCAFYALKDGYDKKIDVFKQGSYFGFSDLLTEKERDEWLDKFNPKMDE